MDTQKVIDNILNEGNLQFLRGKQSKKLRQEKEVSYKRGSYQKKILGESEEVNYKHGSYSRNESIENEQSNKDNMIYSEQSKRKVRYPRGLYRKTLLKLDDEE